MGHLKKIAASVVAGLLWLWAVLPRAMDWVGRTTLPDDWESLMSEKLPIWAAWLFSTPWWVPALLATALTIWLMYVSWPRQAKVIETNQPTPIAFGELKTIYEGHFEKETVELDGRSFVNCSFRDVTFKYNGGHYDMKGCNVAGFGFTSDNPGILWAVDLVGALLNFNRKEVTDGRGITRIVTTVPTVVIQPNLTSESQPLPSIEQKTQP